MSVLHSQHFHDEAKISRFLEGIIWADGIACTDFGVIGGWVYDLNDVPSKVNVKHPEGIVGHGLKKCGKCHKQFTETVGTVFEHARMPQNRILLAVQLIVSSRKGNNAHHLSLV